jgi:hypothetical protein
MDAIEVVNGYFSKITLGRYSEVFGISGEIDDT